MKLYEFVVEDMAISDVTKKSIEKNGTGQVHFVKAIVENNALELLIEVESSHKTATHVDMKGNQKAAFGYGYACIVRFEDIDKALHGEKLSRSNIQDVLDTCDVKVHCDCPAFYWQGMHQDDSANNTARYKFQGTGGAHKWTMIHVDAHGKTGKALCKHLYAALEWLKINKGVIEDYLKLQELKQIRYKKLVEKVCRNFARQQLKELLII